MPEPTGPAPTNPEAALRRNVNAAMMTLDGTEPLRGAFIRASHDKMMSTFGEAIPAQVAATYADPENIRGVWPVRASLATEHELGVYDDGGAPCGCPDAECANRYPEGHTSVDLRTAPRRVQERFSEAARVEAAEAGPLLRID